jgi:hypothetical protein
MKIKKLENGFVMLECEFCGKQIALHKPTDDMIKNKSTHKDKCYYNPETHSCETCRYGTTRYNCVNICSITGLPTLSNNSQMPCWQPKVSMLEKIKKYFRKGGRK